MKTQKTKKSFKKKALLSSLSMLMVATVAVGSATFAWFTQSPDASVSGLKMKATASNGLKILTESREAAEIAAGTATPAFISNDTLRYTKTGETVATNSSPFLLNPASYFTSVGSTSTLVGYTTTAEAAESSAAKSDAVVNKATEGYGTSGDVYKEKIKCKLIGATDANATQKIYLNGMDVQLNTAENTALRDSVRMILTYYDAKAKSEKVIGMYAPTATAAEATDNAIKTVTTPGTTTYENSTLGTVKFTAFPTTTSAKVEMGEVGTTGNDYVNVYVYLDGMDSNCTTGNINMNQILTNVQINLTITPPAAP